MASYLGRRKFLATLGGVGSVATRGARSACVVDIISGFGGAIYASALRHH
jgi:hypothetical protein